jgi:hypothetical protein
MFLTCSIVVPTSGITPNLLFDNAIVSAEVALVRIQSLSDVVDHKISLLYRENSIFSIYFGVVVGPQCHRFHIVLKIWSQVRYRSQVYSEHLVMSISIFGELYFHGQFYLFIYLFIHFLIFDMQRQSRLFNFLINL